MGRDVFNEKLGAEDSGVAGKNSMTAGKLASQVIFYTNLGEIHVKLFPAEVPKTVENFVTHARNGYYNNVIFHRVIKSFMI